MHHFSNNNPIPAVPHEELLEAGWIPWSSWMNLNNMRGVSDTTLPCRAVRRQMEHPAQQKKGLPRSAHPNEMSRIWQGSHPQPQPVATSLSQHQSPSQMRRLLQLHLWTRRKTSCSSFGKAQHTSLQGQDPPFCAVVKPARQCQSPEGKLVLYRTQGWTEARWSKY